MTLPDAGDAPSSDGNIAQDTDSNDNGGRNDSPSFVDYSAPNIQPLSESGLQASPDIQEVEDGDSLISYFQAISDEIDPSYRWNIVKIGINLMAQFFVLLAIEDAVAENNGLLETISTLLVNSLLNYFVAEIGINECVDALRGQGKEAWSFSTLLRLMISILPSINYVEIPMENPGVLKGVPKDWLWLFLLPFAAFSWRSSKKIIAFVESVVQPLNGWNVYTKNKELLLEKNKQKHYQMQVNQLFDALLSQRNEEVIHDVISTIVPLVHSSEEISKENTEAFMAVLRTHSERLHLSLNNSDDNQYINYFLTFILGLLCTISYLGYMAETSQSFEKQGERGVFFQLCALAAIASTTVLSFIVGGNISNTVLHALKEDNWRSSFLYKHMRRLTGISVPIWCVLAGFSAGLATALTENYLSKNIFLIILDFIGTIVFNTYPYPELLYSFAMSWFMSMALKKINEFMSQKNVSENTAYDEENPNNLEACLLENEGYEVPGMISLTEAEKEALYLKYLTTFRDTVHVMNRKDQQTVMHAILGIWNEPNDDMHIDEIKKELGVPSKKQWGLNVAVFSLNAMMAVLCFSNSSDIRKFTIERWVYMVAATFLNMVAYKASELLLNNPTVINQSQEMAMLSVEDSESLDRLSVASSYLSFLSLNNVTSNEITLFGRIVTGVAPLCVGALSLWMVELAARYFKGVLEEMPKAYVTVPLCAFVAMHLLPKVSSKEMQSSLSIATP